MTPRLQHIHDNAIKSDVTITARFTIEIKNIFKIITWHGMTFLRKGHIVFDKLVFQLQS